MDSGMLLPGRTNGELAELRPGEALGNRGYQPMLSSEQGVADYWRILLKRKWTIITCLVIVFVLALVASLRMTPIYEASGRIAMNRENPLLGFKDQQGGGGSGDDVDFANLETQVMILQSNSLALQVMKKLYPPRSSGVVATQASPRDEQNQIFEFRHNLKVATIPNTRMIEVRFASADPRLAAEAVNTLINTYIEQNLKTKYDSTMQAADWLSKQLADLQIKVEMSQQKLVDYQKEHEILGADEKQNTVTNKLDELNRALTNAEADRIQKESLYQLTLSGNPESIAVVEQNGLVQKLREQQVDLQSEIAQMSTQFGPAYPKLAELRNKLKQVQVSLADELAKSAKRIQTDYTAASAREALLRKAFNEQKAEANRLNENAIEYNLLKREAESNRQLYDGLLQKLKEAGISAGLNSNNVRIVDPARVPTVPARPNIPRNLQIAALLGLTGGIALAFALEGLDKTVRTPDEVEYVASLPSLGMIPMISTLSGHRNRHALSFSAATSKDESVALISLHRPQSEMSEAYRSLRTQILLSAAGSPPKIILVTSALPEDGKTTTAVNCAVVLAQQGRRVLLVDADFRRPSVHKKLGLRARTGLSNVLTGGQTIASTICRTPHLPTLSVVPAGSLPPHPAELLGSENIRELLAQWREEYDHVIIDSPPVLSVTDAVVLAVKVDTVILVIRSGRTTKAALRRSRDLLLNVGANVMGVVVNAVNLNSPDYYYYYYSGAKSGGYYTSVEDDEPPGDATAVNAGEAS